MTFPQPEGFLAEPESGKGRGVLVLHPWWGLNDTMKNVCTRLAEAGFVAFAPDMFHGKVATTVEEAEKLARSHDGESAMTDSAAALEFLCERTADSDREIAVIGFSFGAYYATEMSAKYPDRVRAVVVFYGTNRRDYEGSKAAYLAHFAESDQFEPESEVKHFEEALRKGGCPVEVYRYPDTGHWFFEPDRTDAYNEAAANLAWERTVEFLDGVLNGNRD
ncbi:MAG TPA: dienelactone hydrolase family protein [candidate division Zixibacteria bacterium]|nr:dienelactone hydrolase family protein [candidate division Zixibacteria bacterium]